MSVYVVVHAIQIYCVESTTANTMVINERPRNALHELGTARPMSNPGGRVVTKSLIQKVSKCLQNIAVTEWKQEHSQNKMRLSIIP